MPEINFDNLSLEQGFFPRGDVQDAFGFLPRLSIAGQTFATDINVSANFVSFSGSVAAVLQSFRWGGGMTDAIELKANISTKNRNLLFSMLHAFLASTKVTLDVKIFYFDQASATFYQALGVLGGNILHGQIAKAVKTTMLTLPSNRASGVVKSPQNWEFDLTILPGQPPAQLIYSYGPGNATAKNWGVGYG